MSTKIKFYVRQIKDKNGLYPIYLRVIHNNIKAEGKTILPPIKPLEFRMFNETHQKFEGILPNYNKYFTKVHLNYEQLIYLDNINKLSATTLRDKLLEKENKSNLLVNDYELFLNESIYANKNLKEGTKKNYLKSKNHFFKFLNENNLNKKLITEFKEKEAFQFKDYLLANMSDVSAKHILKNVMPFFKKSLKQKKITSDPFEDLTIKANYKEITVLESSHIRNLRNLKLDNFPGLEFYKDVFLFLCYTGMSYVDFANIKRSQLRYDEDLVSLKYNRVKTGISSEQYLINDAIYLLKKYANDPRVLITNSLLPIVHGNEVNKKIKIIGHMIGFSYPLLTKHSRRWFRKSLMLAEIPEDITKRTMMGHTRNTIENHYLTNDLHSKIDAYNRLNNYYLGI